MRLTCDVDKAMPRYAQKEAARAAEVRQKVERFKWPTQANNSTTNRRAECTCEQATSSDAP
jgi:hypothetical protein